MSRFNKKHDDTGQKLNSVLSPSPTILAKSTLDLITLLDHYISIAIRITILLKYLCNSIINKSVPSESIQLMLPLVYPPFSCASGLGSSSPEPDILVLV